MVKAPVAGRVKTRLAREMGVVPAAWWFRHQVLALLRRLSDPRWRLVLAVAGQPSAAVWPVYLQRIAQVDGDLGTRMRALLEAGARGAPVCLIGGDIPGVQKRHIARAFSLLGRAPTVFGPAEDGGYWLLGRHHGGLRLPTPFLRDVRWSGPAALEDSIRSLRGQPFALSDTLADIDTMDDLRRYHGAAVADGAFFDRNSRASPILRQHDTASHQERDSGVDLPQSRPHLQARYCQGVWDQGGCAD